MEFKLDAILRCRRYSGRRHYYITIPAKLVDLLKLSPNQRLTIKIVVEDEGG